MAVIALNCGSSSLKGATFVGGDLTRERDARVENLGSVDATLRVESRVERLDGARDAASVLPRLLSALTTQLREPVDAIVHRVVHGGERFTAPTRIDDDMLKELDGLSTLAPLHNPPAIEAIRAARSAFADTPHFAVFDTAFHRTLPPHAREYALPQRVREAQGIRRFGFHGISHEHVMHRVASQMRVRTADVRLVSLHLGNGASLTAIEHGASVETSMGMTPLEGLVMGTRAGDVDPGVLLELQRTHDRDALENLLMRESGLRGIAGTNDLRAIEQQAGQGDARCQLALDIYVHRICKYIGAYVAIMGGVDAIAFTGGVGENSELVRRRAVERLGFLGVQLDASRNRAGLQDHDCVQIATDESRVRLYILRADEERAMAAAIMPLVP